MMLRLSAALASCGAVYAAYVLFDSSDFEAGTVNSHHSMCAAFALIASTLIIAAPPQISAASVAVKSTGGLALVVGLSIAVAAWSIPYSDDSGYLGIITVMFGLPMLGLLSVAAVLVALGTLIAELVASKATGR
ncbi:hypothetical protein BI49514_00072 [Brevibacterium iodinum ATCC 49514]|uniref:Uncharacterized protein n=1 Tax=Brevibacterium iodinum ATCC 49514 TaxID=1255616 RepID=A0A2H1HNX0_9MICO|nr:hypothetical protein [Brevibacterium iodinum]SMX64556.1 hypothetical protein BI49514_00072 [Brevibacterium iodinum ATCC 49514]SUW13356.1 Uncharacterised protein [Brevibacterium iodinum]